MAQVVTGERWEREDLVRCPRGTRPVVGQRDLRAVAVDRDEVVAPASPLGSRDDLVGGPVRIVSPDPAPATYGPVVSRYVIDARTLLYLVDQHVLLNPDHGLVAPTRIRSEALQLLLNEVNQGVRGESVPLLAPTLVDRADDEAAG